MRTYDWPFNKYPTLPLWPFIPWTLLVLVAFQAVICCGKTRTKEYSYIFVVVVLAKTNIIFEYTYAYKFDVYKNEDINQTTSWFNLVTEMLKKDIEKDRRIILAARRWVTKNPLLFHCSGWRLGCWSPNNDQLVNKTIQIFYSIKRGKDTTLKLNLYRFGL